jgi:protein involved in polysaccharide export with SLBB domain
MQPVKLGARQCCMTAAAVLGLTFWGPAVRAQTVLGTPQDANNKIKEMSAAARIAPHDYVIGPGDTISIDVFDVKELSRDVRVSPTGTIGLPLVPVRLQVKGLTETQAEEKIAEVLQANGLVTHPEVSVAVKERKSKPITVVGAVPHPMVYQAERPVTLLEVLAEAGGVANDAGDTAIVTRPPSGDQSESSDAPALSTDDVIPTPAGFDSNVGAGGGTAAPPAKPDTPAGAAAPVAGATPVSPATKPPMFPTGGPPPATSANGSTNGPTGQDAPIPTIAPPLANTITVNLNELMESGDATNNIVLQAGDIVTVPHAGIVYVLGAVGRPGGYVLANDRSPMTALKMLSLAGGFTHTAKTDHAVIVRKDNQGQQHEQTIDLKKIVNRQAEDVRLQSSDIIYVPDSTAKQVLVRASEIALSVGTGVALYRVAYRQ